MKEVLIYSLAAIASLVVFGYSIHMFIGGLVSPEVETAVITIGCLIAATVIGFLAWDVVKRRQGNSN